jgi:hypothetical protein
MAYAEPSSLISYLGKTQGAYSTIYEVNDNFIPQISFKVGENINKFFLKLQEEVKDDYEVKLENLPKGKVISLLPTRKTLCLEHKLCDLNIFSYISKRFKKMKLLSFVKAFDHNWGSLQSSDQIQQMLSKSLPQKTKLFNVNLSESMKSSFMMQDYKSSSIYGKSNLSLEKAMKLFDEELRSVGKRLGKIEKKNWVGGNTLSGLYQVKNESIFILIQALENQSLVQVQRTAKIKKEDFDRIFMNKKLIN